MNNKYFFYFFIFLSILISVTSNNEFKQYVYNCTASSNQWSGVITEASAETCIKLYDGLSANSYGRINITPTNQLTTSLFMNTTISQYIANFSVIAQDGDCWSIPYNIDVSLCNNAVCSNYSLFVGGVVSSSCGTERQSYIIPINSNIIYNKILISVYPNQSLSPDKRVFMHEINITSSNTTYINTSLSLPDFNLTYDNIVCFNDTTVYANVLFSPKSSTEDIFYYSILKENYYEELFNKNFGLFNNPDLSYVNGTWFYSQCDYTLQNIFLYNPNSIYLELNNKLSEIGYKLTLDANKCNALSEDLTFNFGAIIYDDTVFTFDLTSNELNKKIEIGAYEYLGLPFLNISVLFNDSDNIYLYLNDTLLYVFNSTIATNDRYLRIKINNTISENKTNVYFYVLDTTNSISYSFLNFYNLSVNTYNEGFSNMRFNYNKTDVSFSIDEIKLEKLQKIPKNWELLTSFGDKVSFVSAGAYKYEFFIGNYDLSQQKVYNLSIDVIDSIICSKGGTIPQNEDFYYENPSGLYQSFVNLLYFFRFIHRLANHLNILDTVLMAFKGALILFNILLYVELMKNNNASPLKHSIIISCIICFALWLMLLVEGTFFIFYFIVSAYFVAKDFNNQGTGA